MESGISSVHKSSGSTLNYGDYGYNMTDEKPLFMDGENGVVALAPTSPCINRGKNSLAPAKDINGIDRPHISLVDMGAYEYTGPMALTCDSYELSVSNSAKTFNFAIDAGPHYASRKYNLLGSVIGTAPGFPIKTDLTLPLNLNSDPLFMMIVAGGFGIFNDFIYQTLDASGCGSANMVFWNGAFKPSHAGHIMFFAFYTYDPKDYVSNVIGVELVP